MQDKGTCPYCRNDFEVTQYGWRIPCPHCRRRVNIFPDAVMFIHTSFGVCGIGIADLNHIDVATLMHIVPKRKVGNVLSGIMGFLHE